MEKIDYKKELKEFYNPSTKEISEVDVPKMNFLMVDGKGDPNTSKEFTDAIQTLYPIAYGIKFVIKKSTGPDFGVMPLEGLWWVKDMNDFMNGNRDNWQWTLMIMQPESVTKEIIEKVLAETKKKKKLPMVDKIRFESYDEGKSAQIMHIGPYSEEGPNIMRIHKYFGDKGGKLNGKHHEIYLSDARRVNPAKMKTVVRQPFSI